MTTWKRHERRVAAKLNGHRNGATGKATADVENERLAIECKSRRKLPDWLHSAMQQAVNAATDEQTPIVILHEVGRHSANDLVVLRMQDFEAIISGDGSGHFQSESNIF